METEDLFDDIHNMDDNELSCFYKKLFDLKLEWNGGYQKGVGLWLTVFIDGIYYECADRICGTFFNSKDAPKGIRLVQ